jgi:hypothetical protein
MTMSKQLRAGLLALYPDHCLREGQLLCSTFNPEVDLSSRARKAAETSDGGARRLEETIQI